MNVDKLARKIDKDDLVRVADARATVRWLRLLAIAAGVLGVVSLVAILWFLLEGSMTAGQATAALFSSAFFTIFSGATAYGAASNLDLNASRMEREIKRSELDLDQRVRELGVERVRGEEAIESPDSGKAT